MVNRLHIMATGDVITIVAVTRATVEVYGHVMLGPAWSWTLHENTRYSHSNYSGPSLYCHFLGMEK